MKTVMKLASAFVFAGVLGSASLGCAHKAAAKPAETTPAQAPAQPAPQSAPVPQPPPN